MIRPAESSDTDAMVAVWLDASLRAHDFVPGSFWHSQAQAMRDAYLPAAQSYVDARDGEVTGFISLVDDHLAALFVSPAHQGHGIGAALLGHAQSMRPSLDVQVYAENARALRFYSRHGFVRTIERVDKATGAQEVVMRWPVAF